MRFYAFPSGYEGASAITTGSDGALWFTNSSFTPSIGRVTTSGVLSEVYVSSVPGFFLGITAGPDGALWFTESNANKIGRITTEGALTEYILPTANAYPYQITPGPDGALWFTEQNASAIGSITTAGLITEYPVIVTGGGSAMPYAITAGPDGALWFTMNTNDIGRITTGGVVSSYFFDAYFLGPGGITVGSDSALWFGANLIEGGELGRLTTSGLFSFYSTPANGDVGSITKALNGSLWFTGLSVAEIGEAVTASASLSATPSTGAFGTAITLAGSGFGPGESVNLFAHSTSANLLTTVIADPTGSFSFPTTIGPVAGIEHSVVGVGQNSHKIGVGNYAVTASISCTPNQGVAGTITKIESVGLQPNVPNYAVYFGTHYLGELPSDEVGAIVLDFTIPAQLAPGVYSVSVNAGLGPVAQANFTIN